MPAKVQWKVVEVAKDEPLEPMSADIAQQVKSLQYHPGFVYLTRKLRTQRALLRSTLERERQTTLTDSEFLKSGIAWCGWLDDQVTAAVGFLQRATAPREAIDAEQEAFAQIASNIEIVGA